MLDTAAIRAITIDLDDTLWPIWPTIVRAEAALQDWLGLHAAATAALCAVPANMRAVREDLQRQRPELAHDLSALRRESIRLLLERAGDAPALAEPAFEVFFAERQRVELFADALPALDFLSARWPLVALSNGNADLGRVGLARYFHGAVSARGFGVGKPDARIFHAAAQAAGVPASAVLHIGDDLALDVLGARNAGMQAAWLNRAGTAWPPAEPLPQLIAASLSALCLHLV